MQKLSARKFHRDCSTTLHAFSQVEGLTKPMWILSPKFLPAAGTTAAFDFTERRHVPVTAQPRRYANCPILNSGVMSLIGTKQTFGSLSDVRFRG
jgi:hypothetical protein